MTLVNALVFLVATAFLAWDDYIPSHARHAHSPDPSPPDSDPLTTRSWSSHDHLAPRLLS